MESFHGEMADRSAENQLQNSFELADTLGQTMRSRQHLLLADIEQAYENFERELSYVINDLVNVVHANEH
jgi:hypothetical protein